MVCLDSTIITLVFEIFICWKWLPKKQQPETSIVDLLFGHTQRYVDREGEDYGLSIMNMLLAASDNKNYIDYAQPSNRGSEFK